MNLSKLILFLLIFTTHSAWSYEFGLGAGILHTSNTQSTESDPRLSLNGGLIYTNKLGNETNYRIGLFYYQKNIKADIDSTLDGKEEISLTYMSLPLTIEILLTKKLNFIIGVAPQSLVSSSCENEDDECDLQDEVTFSYPVQIGLSESFTNFRYEFIAQLPTSITADKLSLATVSYTVFYLF